MAIMKKNIFRKKYCGLVSFISVLIINVAMLFTCTSPQEKRIFSRDRLVAWCIVPFDAKARGPQQRAEMLQRLGLKRVAYDWRPEHVPQFEDEILAYKKYGIEYFAFWSWHDEIAPLIKKHGIKPQIWRTVASPPDSLPSEVRVAAAAKKMLPFVQKAAELGCQFGLYNHGGWGGEPENMVAVCKWLRQNAGADHAGIVYNFHHGHGHIDDFAESFEKMKPYLLCLNLNGMNTDAKPKILPVGDGEHDLKLIKIIAKSGYNGPIGILGHVESEDVEVVLDRNLKGLKKLLAETGDDAALKSYE
jgi:sugar phosphate isomerase/epimerase